MKKLLFFVFLIFSFSLFAQKEANIWYFGENAGLDFNSGIPVPLLDGKLNTEGGSATISDSNGSLLFYTDGRTVWNKNHKVMQNGLGLNGGKRSTHSAIVVPKPNDSNKYFIFTIDDYIGNNGLQYSEVDMSLDSGLGGITSTKNVPLHTPTTEKITAVKSAVANEYWVVSHKWGNNEFIAFKVTSSGVNPIPVISKVGTVVDDDGASIGQIKIAPNGKKIAVARYPSISEVQIFDFDNSTGKISNPLTLLKYFNNEQIYGLEFSPNGQLLYTAVNYEGFFQFNLNAGSSTDIVNSKVKLSTTDVNHDSFQIAPDGKIYIAGFAHSYLGVINNPNTIGLGANYVSDALYLNGRLSFSGLPGFVQSFFNISFQSKNFCFGDATLFEANSSESYDSILWNFGDGTTSTQENPTHKYNQTGTYSVTLTVIAGANTSFETQEIIIYKTPNTTQPTNLITCDIDNDGFYNFNLTTQTNTILNGQLLTDFEVDYFASVLDYSDDTKIPDYTNYQNTKAYQEQTIIARVRNKKNSNCEAITEFKIQVFEAPKPKLASKIPNLSFCDNLTVGNDRDGKMLFNLTDRATEILNGQSATDFLVSYYIDEDLSQPIINETNYENLNATQRIYAKVENRTNDTCFAKTSFLIEVFKLPAINSPVSLKQCDNSDINGFSAFNLNEAKSKIVASPNDYVITFFEEEILAENNTSPITNSTTYTNDLVSNDTVWARVENANGCYRVSKINLIVSTTEIPTTFLKTFYKCDNGTNIKDGIATFDFSSVTKDIKDLFPTGQQLIIKYYRNEADGLAEQNEITDISNYENIGYLNQQDIFVRVDSKLDNACLGLGHHITLNVEKVPVANSVTIDPECDNDRDGLFTFDTSTIQNTIVGTQTNVVVRYFDENNIQLPSPLPNPFTTASQTIRARIVNTNSQDSDGQCFDETTIAFVVNSVPIANAVPPQEQCDDDTDGIAGFDTSTIETMVLGSQTGLIVKYFDKNDVALPSPLPNPFYTSSQTIKVRLENPIYDVCYEETTVDFVVREKPTFNVIDEAIICMTSSPKLDLEIQNPNGTYTYTWTDENNTIISDLPMVTVTKGGVYKVIATSVLNCVSEEKEIIINESSISTININDIEVVDDIANNSIQINSSNLGLGDYEFRLLDENSFIIKDYQDEPFFENLDGGIYTIEVNDKNGCGSIPFEVSLLSFPKFFTPNGDGKNDTWTVKGISKNFYKNGKISIFDRYGKIITNFNLNDSGWDGTYNGKILQSNDYWFVIELLDKKGNKRLRKGNFSLLRK